MDKKDLIKKKLRAKRNGNMRELADVTNCLGDLYFQLQRLDEAFEEYQEEIKACDILGDKLNSAVAHRMIGEILVIQGEYEEALKHQNLHLVGAQEVKNELEEQRALATLGRTYFLLADSLVNNAVERTRALASARKANSRCIVLCDRLKDIPKQELMQMRARVLQNQGLVLEAQMEPNEAMKLFNSAIEISTKYKNSEDLHRAHLALGGLYERQGNTDLALEHFNLAAKTDDTSLKANALLTKSEFFLRIGEWKNARRVLITLYPMKNLLQSTKEQIEKLLRIAVTLCRGEEKLESPNSEINNFKVYEELGDAAAAVCSYNKALGYYKNMLHYAEKDESDEGIAAALVSLAQTFKDVGQYIEALDFAQRELKICSDPREVCRSALFLADLSELAGLQRQEIVNAYEIALSKARITGDPSLEVRVLQRYVHYLNHLQSEDTEEIRTRLDLLLATVPNVESEKEIVENSDIGADICLDELSDLELPQENEDENKPRRPKSTRKKGPVIKRNEKGETQLHVACISGSIEKVERLIENGHSPNVRDNCGWSPLHEAANHGFVEIVRLLLNAGANVNDRGGPECNGITPLHDAACCGHFSVINLLMEKGADIYALTNDGDSTLDSLEDWRKRVEDITPTDESEFKYLQKKLSARGVPRKKQTDSKIVRPVATSRNRNRIISDDEVGDEDSKSTIINAGEDYKRTIAVLRDRGARLPVLNKNSDSHKNLPPLLDSEQILEDEWLDDDMGINSNKKKNNCDDPLSTAKRKSSGSGPAGERESKRQRIRSDDGIQQLINICDEEESCDSIFDSPIELEKRNRPKKQSSLMSAGFSRLSVSRTPSPIFEIVQKDKSQIEEVDLSVWIEQKLFKLKLDIKTDQKITAQSIVDQLKKKFQEETGCLPQFELLTPTGNTLSPQDTIDELFTSANSINLYSRLTEKMNVPPISDRYRKICNTWNVGIEEGTIKCLKTCENTLTFRLKGRETLDAEISPLLKSLEYQIKLQVLHLSGGSFNDVGEMLHRCLANLTSLQELHLRCCDIDSNCLSEIDKLPLLIKVLDLSYNPLGKNSRNQLHKLLCPLQHLQTLNLSNCEVQDILPGTSGTALINVDISWNRIKAEGLRCLLQPHMLSLNASGLGAESSITNELLSHRSFSLATLETLELSSCDLTDSDLSKILLQTANLTRLIVNGNAKLTKNSVLKVLQHMPALSYIDISACEEVTEPPDFEINIARPDVCTLVISMAPEIQPSWLSLWCGMGSIQALPHRVVIFKPITN